MRSTITLRFYFATSTLCLTGSLIQVSILQSCRYFHDNNEDIDEDGKTTQPIKKVHIWVIIYFLSLALTFYVARIDLYFETVFQLISSKHDVESIIASMDISRQELLGEVKKWRSISIFRSVCCIIAWLLACHTKIDAN